MALERIEAAEKSAEPILRSSATGQRSRCENAFLAAIQAQAEKTWPVRSDPSYTLNVIVDATYPNRNDHFLVDTEIGPVRIRSIKFRGEVAYERLQVPMIRQDEYRNVGEEAISQITAFQPVDLGRMGRFALEFHRLPSLGCTEILLRRHTIDEA